MSAENRLNCRVIEQHLATRLLGRRLVYLPITLSTNDIAREEGRSGAPEGTLVVADEQTAGRGRLRRTWLAPAGSSLLMSLVLRPPLQPDKVFCLVMISATAVAEAIEQVTGLPCGIKWPNDIFIRGRKVAGILSEMSLVAGEIDFTVIGIGLNVNADLSTLDEIAATATSLSTELGHAVSRERLLCQVLLEFEKRYLILLDAINRGGCHNLNGASLSDDNERVADASISYWSDAISQEWRSRLITLGQWVTVHDGDKVEEGLAEDVNSSGALLIRRSDGSAIQVAAGDVSLRGFAHR